MTDPIKLGEALANVPWKYDLIGPTVDDDIRRAISRYGVEAVKDAVKRQTKGRIGRKPERDWPELRDVIEGEARIWLAGGDPIAARSNYAIAKDFAHRNPGQSAVSTHQRIERKLAKKPHDRLWFILASAEQMSRDGYPHETHLRALRALVETKAEPVWEWVLEQAMLALADYEAKTGKPAPKALSMKEVEEAARNAVLPLSALATPGTLAGLLSAYSSKNPHQG